jgi:hypothetical protein
MLASSMVRRFVRGADGDGQICVWAKASTKPVASSDFDIRLMGASLSLMTRAAIRRL